MKRLSWSHCISTFHFSHTNKRTLKRTNERTRTHTHTHARARTSHTSDTNDKRQQQRQRVTASTIARSHSAASRRSLWPEMLSQRQRQQRCLKMQPRRAHSHMHTHENTHASNDMNDSSSYHIPPLLRTTIYVVEITSFKPRHILMYVSSFSASVEPVVALENTFKCGPMYGSKRVPGSASRLPFWQWIVCDNHPYARQQGNCTKLFSNLMYSLERC